MNRLLRSPYALVIWAILLLLVVAVVVTRGDDGDDDVARLGDAQEAIDLPASRVDPAILERAYERFDGSEARLSDEVGRPIVVNFFASWCVACVRELPDFEQVSQEVADDVAFIGFAVQDGRAAAEALLERAGVTYAIADDPDAAFADGFGSLAMPTTAIIDADGVVVDVHSGQLTADELRDRLAEVLG